MLPSVSDTTRLVLTCITYADSDEEAREIFTEHAKTLLGHGFDQKTFGVVVQLASRPQLKYYVLNFSRLFN